MGEPDESEDEALDAALREMFLVPAAKPAEPEPDVALASLWHRIPRLL